MAKKYTELLKQLSTAIDKRAPNHSAPLGQEEGSDSEGVEGREEDVHYILQRGFFHS